MTAQAAPLVNFRVYRKIDIYRKTTSGLVYLCSSNAYPRCRDAVQSLARQRGYPVAELVGRFDRRGR